MPLTALPNREFALPCRSHHASGAIDELSRPLEQRPTQPLFDAEVLERGVGILFNGRERDDVSEYCVSEGWIRAPAGKSKDRFGQPITIKLKGTVEPFAKP